MATTIFAHAAFALMFPSMTRLKMLTNPENAAFENNVHKDKQTQALGTLNAELERLG